MENNLTAWKIKETDAHDNFNSYDECVRIGSGKRILI